MIEIEKTKFLEKFTEINFRQRMYEGKNFITLIVNMEVYPSLVKDSIISGSVEVKVDLEGISSIDELVGKCYDGDIGKVTISINNDGIWEHQTNDKFKFEVKGRNGRILDFVVVGDNFNLDVSGVMVSLYTISTSKEELNKIFKLDDFYESFIEKEVGSSKIMKFFVKE